MTVLRATTLVDVPLRAASAALTERSLFGGTGPLAPGAELRVLGARLRVAETTVSGLRLVPVGARPLALAVRLDRTPDGVRVTGSATFRRVRPARVSGLLEWLVYRIRARATELAGGTVVVGAAVLRGRTLLAQQRAYPASVAGRWELPGGRVEPMESDVDAVVRECAEELGVAVLVGAAVGPDVALPGTTVLRIYRAELADPHAEPHPHDHRALCWLTAGRLGPVDWLPADRVLVPALRRLLRPPA